jgi:hypothetical protein
LATVFAGALVFGAAGTTTANAYPYQSVLNLTSSVLTVEKLVDVLIGDATDVSNIKYTGSAQQLGTFDGFTTLGVSSGVVLSTGFVSNNTNSAVPGPATATRKSGQIGSGVSDPDLNALLPGTETTLDATSLEFDFVPKSNKLMFDYIFASEEYADYVFTRYNDVFGLFVNGVNCAVVGPNRDIVSVNNVNNGYQNNGVNAKNSAYYRNNSSYSNPVADTGFNGLTTVLTCEVAVNPGVKNHIKFAIGDVGDSALDSGVFIVANSFVTEFPEAVDDLAQTKEGTAVTIPVLDNDFGTGLSITNVTNPSNGTAVLQGDKVIYTPNLGFWGTDTFQYSIINQHGVSDTATVTVVVDRVLVLQKVVVVYVDDDNGGAVVTPASTAITTIFGYAGESVGYTVADAQAGVPTGYVYASLDNVATFHDAPNVNQTITVHLVQRHTIGTFTTTRTITYVGAGADTPGPVVQTVTWTTDTNDVTGVITYTPTTAGYPALDSPAIALYTVSPVTVPAASVTASNVQPSNLFETVTYTAYLTVAVFWVDVDNGALITPVPGTITMLYGPDGTLVGFTEDDAKAGMPKGYTFHSIDNVVTFDADPDAKQVITVFLAKIPPIIETGGTAQSALPFFGLISLGFLVALVGVTRVRRGAVTI